MHMLSQKVLVMDEQQIDCSPVDLDEDKVHLCVEEWTVTVQTVILRTERVEERITVPGGRALLADKRWVAEIWNDRSGGLVTSDGRPRLQETNACCIGCVKPYRPINEEQYELNRLSGGVRAASDGIVHR
ncbi:hypothetical protein DPX16_4186 [Anabarilius grahami]|uniref:Uncharacterized protein n=1 Tax=Anabarilius grahami TaxID=495550 RepID=A0A3N0XTM5_ANAGA|nr:hypothetical protein DPX16_4186 [Anabarilius grahami]